MNIYGLLNLGRGALLTQQEAINTTSHNIANVNTPGYTRQRLNMGTNTPLSFWSGQVGTGVSGTGVERIYDRFLGFQVNDENQNLGKWEAEKNTLERVEMIFDESTGYGLNQGLSEFWNGWQDLVNNPSGLTERTSLLSKSESLALTFNQTRSDLEKIRTDLDKNIEGTVDEINQITEQIADLNQKIAQAETGGQEANDYRDKRDLLLKDLSSKIDINSFEGSDGKITVLAANGRPLVQNDHSRDLSTRDNALSGHKDIVWLDSEDNPTDIASDINGGKLKGWLEVRDNTIPEYMDRLDSFAGSIIEKVNELHQSGYAMTTDPLTGDPYTGVPFFSGTDASDIAVNSDIIDDVNMIAAAETVGGVPGDNGMAIQISNLQNALTMNDDNATFDNYYNSLVSDVGTDVRGAAINYDHQSSVVTHLDNYRESVSGVSLDEEMVNLIKFQHAYEAAAKIISTADELLQTVINMT